MDLWVERIPYRETRAYVKAVAAAHRMYQQLYAPTIAVLPLDGVPAPTAGIDY